MQLHAPEAELQDLAVLAEPVRRRLYLHALRAEAPVSRDAAAQALGIGRSLAAFHLDRLARAGLLETEYRRLSGRSGPGAGRPAKLYRPATRGIAVTLPPRRYEVAADLFASALEQTADVGRVLEALAGKEGAALGAQGRHRAGARAGYARRLAAVVEVMDEAGYAPQYTAGELRLRNCPFRAVAERHRSVTCGTNLALVKGMLAAAGLEAAAARLDIQPEWCCVVIDANLARAPEARP